MDVVDSDDEIVVEDDAADDAEGSSNADEAAEGGDDDEAADAVKAPALEVMDKRAEPLKTTWKVSILMTRCRKSNHRGSELVDRGACHSEAQRCTAGAVVRFQNERCRVIQERSNTPLESILKSRWAMCKVPRKIILPLHPNFALSMYELHTCQEEVPTVHSTVQ